MILRYPSGELLGTNPTWEPLVITECGKIKLEDILSPELVELVRNSPIVEWEEVKKVPSR